jgi:hypothetical protein
MSTLVLIGKLVRVLNRVSEWLAGFLPEGVRDCWAEAQDKEAAVRQRKRRQIATKEDTFHTYLSEESYEVL